MGLNSIIAYSDQELDSQLLKDWILEQFPDVEVVYRGKTFTFHSDIPISAMEEIAAEQLEGPARVAQMIKLLSIDPKITDEDLLIMPSGMLMALYSGITPKKAPTTSQTTNTESISSAML